MYRNNVTMNHINVMRFKEPEKARKYDVGVKDL